MIAILDDWRPLARNTLRGADADAFSAAIVDAVRARHPEALA